MADLTPVPRPDDTPSVPPPSPVIFAPRAGEEPPPGMPQVLVRLEGPTPGREVPWWVRLIAHFATYLFGSLTTLVVVGYWFLKLDAKVDAIDSKIEAKVGNAINEVRKEYSGELKETKEDLAQFRRAIEFERFFQELVCQGAYEAAIQQYFTELISLKPKDFPDAIKPNIYKHLLDAVLKSGKYGVLKEDEIDKMDAALRKDLASCGAATLNRVALVYAALGKFEKARQVGTAVVNVYAVEALGKQGEDTAAAIYATFILIDLCGQKDADPAARAENTWKTLFDLQGRRLLRNSLINASFDTPEMASAISYLSLREGAATRDAISKLRAKLSKIQFEKTWIDRDVVGPDGTRIKVKEAIIVPVELEMNPKKDNLKPIDPNPPKFPGGC